MMRAPNAKAQMRPSVIAVTPGLRGYRVAYVGGAVFDIVTEVPTSDEAVDAYRAAQWASDRLATMFTTARHA
jgi:hypothetical protein